MTTIKPLTINLLTTICAACLLITIWGCQSDGSNSETNEVQTDRLPDKNESETTEILENSIDEEVNSSPDVPPIKKQSIKQAVETPKTREQPATNTENNVVSQESGTRNTIDPVNQTQSEDPDEDLEMLSRYQELSKVAKQDMFDAKRKAENLNSQKLANDLFKTAATHEKEGFNKEEINTINGYIEAQKQFILAKEGYKTAGEIAQSISISNLKNNAQKARLEMMSTKNIVPSQNQKTNYFNQGQSFEEQGDIEMEKGNFDLAIKNFNQANNAFDEAAKVKIKAKEKTPANPPVVESESEVLAKRKIGIMLDQYRQALETFDISGLRGANFISRGEENAWNNFFRNVKELTVKTDNEVFNINGPNAEVSFMVRMSYYNKSKSKRKVDQFTKKWNMTSSGGAWKIISTE